MPGHFDAIGIGTPEELEAALAANPGLASRTALSNGGEHIRVVDSSGAVLSLHTDGAGAWECAHPFFEGTSRQEAVAAEWVLDPECTYCSRLLVNVSEDGEFSYPAVVWVENAGESLAAEVTGRPVVIVAIADAFEAWESEEAFYESESGLASRAFVPIGMFVTPPRRRGFRKPPEPLPEPRALLAGVVASADVRENGWTGGRFATVTLDGYGAATYDVVAPLDLLPTGAAVGSIAEIHATLVARVVLDR